MTDTAQLSRAGIMLRESQAARLVMLRLRKPSCEAIAHVEQLISVSLPIEPNRAAGSDCRAIWMGPNEWMLVEPTAAPGELETIPGSAAVLVVEVGDGRYALDIEGPNALDFLAKAVSIDFHPRVFPVDRSAMTLFAQIPVVIDHIAPDRFRLWFDVSLRAYVRQWCDEALVEFPA